MNLAKKILSQDGVFLSKIFMGSIFKEINEKAKKALKMLLNINLYQAKKNPKKFIFFVKVF